jgi:hypothetical protein
MTERWKIFEALCEHPMGLSAPDLIDLLYSSRADGGPDYPGSTVRMHIQHFNHEAKANRLGIRIRSIAESGRRYRVCIIREPSTESPNTNISDR